ncbi:MAG: shikimate dehydrogenase, partial [Gemmatimonas sp.]
LSPAFQNAALAHEGYSLRYEPLDVEPVALGATLDALAVQGAAGNITIPFKQAVVERAHCTSLAARVGAVNTFWHERGALYGDNTDVAGVVASIVSLCPEGIADTRCVVIGAGGAAAAVLVALEQLGCRDIVMAVRRAEQAQELSERVRVAVEIVALDPNRLSDARLLINATSIGMRENAMPMSPAALGKDAAVLDLVYGPNETAWVRACRAAGHRAEDGLRMLVEQGAGAFERWFAVTAPRDVMWRALSEATGRRA